jgi:hypothetical protein
MKLHLLIPGLFWPETKRTEVYSDLSLPALERILAKSHYTESRSQAIEEWLCQAFGVSKQQDWPVAPIMLHIDGTDAEQTRNEYWLRADPVHLRIENNHILLADSQIFTISLKESMQFAEILNQYFNKSGIFFLPLYPDRWYVRINKTPNLQTRLLSETVGKNINNLLPAGEDSSIWHNIFNEIQMLLHDHQLNQERETRGELAINSIWFWGGGIMPQVIRSTFNQVWCDHAFAHALAVASGIAHYPLPHDATVWQHSTGPNNQLVILDALWGKTQYKNIYEWRQSLSSLEHSWFTPLLEAMRQGKISQLTITALNENHIRNFVMTPSSLWKFWVRTKSLSNYAK